MNQNYGKLVLFIFTFKNNQIFKHMKTNPFSNWWSLALSGIIAILYGLLAFYNPGDMLVTIVSFFGIIILIVGLAMVIGVINNIKNKKNYTADLIWTILTLAVGGVLTFYTTEAVKIFVIIIGVWAILVGVLQLYLMTRLDPGDKNRNSFLINGIITIIFGVILFFDPFASAGAFLIVTGILALIVGVILIVLAIKMKSLSEEFDKIN
jgi:uncharacterized membrane protein HdeD (DUF308 family)